MEGEGMSDDKTKVYEVTADEVKMANDYRSVVKVLEGIRFNLGVIAFCIVLVWLATGCATTPPPQPEESDIDYIQRLLLSESHEASKEVRDEEVKPVPYRATAALVTEGDTTTTERPPFQAVTRLDLGLVDVTDAEPKAIPFLDGALYFPPGWAQVRIEGTGVDVLFDSRLILTPVYVAAGVEERGLKLLKYSKLPGEPLRITAIYIKPEWLQIFDGGRWVR
jgi:hypothetical protein